MAAKVTHAKDFNNPGRTACCKKSILWLPHNDRVTSDYAKVNCRG